MKEKKKKNSNQLNLKLTQGNKSANIPIKPLSLFDQIDINKMNNLNNETF